MDMVTKHDFSRVTFGMMCGMLYDTLEELIVLHCNDWFQVTLPFLRSQCNRVTEAEWAMMVSCQSMGRDGEGKSNEQDKAGTCMSLFAGHCRPGRASCK